MRRALASAIAAVVVLPLTISCVKRKQPDEGAPVAVTPASVTKATGATVRNAITGASATGQAGTMIARQMDKQAQDLAFDLPGAVVQRVGSGIVLTLPEGFLFSEESDELAGGSRDNLRRLATSLEKYPNTRVMLVGHGDSQGATERNMEMSERRARAVASFLVNVGVDRGRITALGRGDTEPIATNDTDAGRQWNRRVEIAIYADEATRFGSRD